MGCIQQPRTHTHTHAESPSWTLCSREARKINEYNSLSPLRQSEGVRLVGGAHREEESELRTQKEAKMVNRQRKGNWEERQRGDKVAEGKGGRGRDSGKREREEEWDNEKKERCRKRGERVIQCPPFAVVAMGTPISPWELTSEFHNPLASCLDWNTIKTRKHTQTNIVLRERTRTHTHTYTQTNKWVSSSNLNILFLILKKAPVCRGTHTHA